MDGHENETTEHRCLSCEDWREAERQWREATECSSYWRQP